MHDTKPETNLESKFAEISDAELVKLTLQNPENFKFLIERYKIKFANYIKRKTSVSNQDVEDILQDAFIKIYLNLNSFDSTLKFSSWGYRIVHNEIINAYRKKSVRPQVNFEDYEEDNLINIFKEDTDIEQDFYRQEIKKHIRGAIDKLDEKYKDIIILRFLEDKDYTEISDILEIPLGTVSTNISRGKKELQKLLEKFK